MCQDTFQLSTPRFATPRRFDNAVSGSHEPNELPNYWSDYLINTRTLRVTYLDEESARELIVQPVEDFTNICDRTTIDAIIHLTRCQPYLVQLTCYEVVELLNCDILRKQARR